MNFFNLAASQNAAGEKVLDVLVYGTIEPGWFDEGGVKSAEIAALLQEHADAVEVVNHINTLGGDVFAGIAIRNLLASHPAAKAGRMRSVVEGIAASAGSIIAMAGTTVMQRGALMMVHSPWTVAAGNADDMRKMADTLDAIGESLVSIYRDKTGKTAAELRKMLAAETWLTADEAKAQGFADEVEGKPVKAKAEGDSIFLNAVQFARAGLPAPVLAMATEPPAVVESAAPIDPGADGRASIDAQASAKPSGQAVAPLTRERIAAEAPDLLAAIKAEGAAEERARLQAIDEIAANIAPDLVAAAKYTAPIDAAALALAAMKAPRAAAPDLLAARRIESAPAAAIRTATPAGRHDAEAAAAKEIAGHANARRGG